MTPLSQEEADALRVVLLDNGVKPGEVSLEDSQSTLEKVQQLLTGLGHTELATSIRAKISKGKVHRTVSAGTYHFNVANLAWKKSLELLRLVYCLTMVTQ